ncbi:ABC transporter permease [Pontiella sp.]|uniref:ABC transporter permease n=1 Tax=Pontiella sp. TaxID=2837462 RepID=UPI003568BED2
MQLPFSLYLAFKYLKPKRSMVSVITVLTMMGIMLGVAVLIVVLSVMTGFDDVHKEHMMKLDSHIQVSLRGDGNYPAEPVLEALKGMPGLKASAPSVEGFVIMTPNGQTVTAVLRGIDPELEKGISDVESYMTEGVLPLDDETVAVADRLAMQLGTFVGDKLTVWSSQCLVSEDEIRLPEELTVSGIFSVGMYEIDSKLMISSLPTARDVFAMEQGVQTLRLLVEEPFAVEKKAVEIRERLAAAARADAKWSWFRYLQVRTWMDINQAMLSTLAVEKNMMFILLCGISLVATMSVTNTLITMCVQKTHEIGLLKALGFSNGQIVGTFFMLGSVQGIFGCLFGVAMGMWVSANLDAVLNFLRIFNPSLMSPEFYMFTEMPSRTTLSDSLSVCVIVMVFSTLAGALPAWRAARMEPVDALRHE